MNQTKPLPPANGGRRKFRNDVIFIAALLAIAVLAGLAILLLRGEGDTVTVTVDGEVFGTYSLSRDTTVEIRTGGEGEELNLLVIREGKALMETATCPDGICTAHRSISRDGESIVCLPHKVVVTVRQTESPDAPDVAA